MEIMANIEIKTIDKKTLNVYGYKMDVEILIKGSGQIVKCLLSINGKTWTSWNLSNHKRNPEQSFNDIEELLKDGSFKMFIVKKTNEREFFYNSFENANREYNKKMFSNFKRN